MPLLEVDGVTPLKSERLHYIDYLTETPLYATFLEKYLTPLKPCLISMPEITSWRASESWLTNSAKGPVPDIDALEQAFRDLSVGVAFCHETDECGGQRREQMTFSAFAALWRQNPRSGLYMKDFHLCVAGQSAAYKTPDIFADDWLNSRAVSSSGGADDFRFIYLGQDGTDTHFHRDVYASHSWSCSLAGIKRWRLVPPEYTHLVRDEKTGDMPDGLYSEGIESRFPNIASARAKALTVWQFPGEAIFVPSGWLHEVKNFGDTLSINHNWANSACLSRMASALQDEVRLGEQALEGYDLGSPAEVAVLVQDLTLRNFGWGWKEFFEMIRWTYLTRKEGPPHPEGYDEGRMWPEASDSLRPPSKVENAITTEVIERWLAMDTSRHLSETKSVAEDILRLLGR